MCGFIRGDLSGKIFFWISKHLDGFVLACFFQRANALSAWQDRAHNVMKHAHRSTAAHDVEKLKKTSEDSNKVDASGDAVKSFLEKKKKYEDSFQLSY